ncbi:MAG: protease modulator HflC [Deltaproteobacteria bacterium]|nr:protease modulator HflC [Deltaproteobacteria bacterium]
MKGKLSIIVIAIIIVLLIVVSSSLYSVDQTKQAIVVQLGKPVGGIKAPGLHVKTPFIQQVIYFDKRLLVYDSPPTEIITSDKKNLIIDNYSKWYIEDPLQFYKSVKNEAGAQARLDDIVYAQLRVEMGKHTLSEIVSKFRNQIMVTVTKKCDMIGKSYGIRITDVRIKRADLPEQNEQHVFERMRAERSREAKRYRSEGEEEALKIRAGADKERTIILAEAERKAEVLKGEGDAVAFKIYAEAYSQDPEFYAFTRSLEAYKNSLKDNMTLVAAPDSQFLKYLLPKKK